MQFPRLHIQACGEGQEGSSRRDTCVSPSARRLRMVPSLGRLALVPWRRSSDQRGQQSILGGKIDRCWDATHNLLLELQQARPSYGCFYRPVIDLGTWWTVGHAPSPIRKSLHSKFLKSMGFLVLHHGYSAAEERSCFQFVPVQQFLATVQFSNPGFV